MSQLEVDKVIPQSGTTITIGDSGDTVNLVGTLQNNGSPLPGDISEVIAGTGLSGGGSTGAVTINIEAAQPTITSLGTITGFTSTGIDDNATSTAITINSSEQVGIGTSSPESALDVGSGTITQREGNVRNTISSSATGFEFIANASSQNVARNFVFKSSTSGGGVNERMRIDSSGRVMVGTTTADGVLKLDNTGQTSETLLTTEDTGGSGAHSHITLKNTTGVVASILTTSDNLEFRVDDATVFGNISGTEHMRITSAGRLGIGTSSPSSGLDVVSTTGPYIAEFRQANTGSPGAIVIDSPADNDGRPSFLNFETGGVLKWGLGLGYLDTNRSFHISTSNLSSGITDSKFTIDTSGNVKIGEGSGATFTVRVTPGAGSWGIDAGTDASSYSRIRISSSGTGTQTKMAFLNTNGEVGSITTAGTSTAFNTSSDYRLKENVSYDFDATTRLKQLKPARFNFIADADTTVDGFLAHEVSSVVPEAISGEKDAVDDDGNPKYQGIDQSKLVPLLVKTIQELEARITQLENA